MIVPMARPTTAPAPASRAAALAALCRRHGVTILYVFGSRADEVAAWQRGVVDTIAGGGSDVDIGVLEARNGPLDVAAKVLLAQSLETLLGVERVDLLSLADADPFVAAQVVRGERLFAENADDADEYDLYVLRRAGDLAPWERERMQLVLEARR